MIGQAVKVIVSLMRPHSSGHKEEVFLQMATTMICATMLIIHPKHRTLFLSHHRTATTSQPALWTVRGATRMRQLLLWLRHLCHHHHDLMIDTHQDRSTIPMASHHLVHPAIATSISLLALTLMSIITLCCPLVFTHLNYIILMPCSHVTRHLNR